MNTEPHKPVMLDEVLKYLDVKDGETYLDCTFGAGGYSNAILKAANCKLIAIDRDPSVQKFAQKLVLEFGSRFTFENENFSNCNLVLEKLGIDKIDGMVLDLGVSSMQLDDRNRGFSFDSDARLDMRMNTSQTIDAYEVVNRFEEEELAKIIFEFGDEPKARAIAKKIVYLRTKKPIETCRDLSSIIHSFYPIRKRVDPSTKSFQAIRIFINRELDELKSALLLSKNILKSGGRLVAVSFHSLEDRIVKAFLKEESGKSVSFSRYEPEIINQQHQEKNFQVLTKSAQEPSQDEIVANIRSRSAKLRAAVKI